jgi:hypothetical protein
MCTSKPTYSVLSFFMLASVVEIAGCGVARTAQLWQQC